jgi:hypothetical protein
MNYYHKQFGTVLVAILAATLVIMALAFGRNAELRTLQVEVPIILLLAIVLFYALTVEIKDGTLFIRMGIGLIRRRIPLADIVQARKVRIPLLAGYGIHGFPGAGWVWNVSGRDGVQLDLVKGGRLIIGTDEPEELVKAIEDKKAQKTFYIRSN